VPKKIRLKDFTFVALQNFHLVFSLRLVINKSLEPGMWYLI
jgi:hypothetical protein